MDYVCFSILLGMTIDTRKLNDIITAARTNVSHTNCDKINAAEKFQIMCYTVSDCGYRCIPRNFLHGYSTRGIVRSGRRYLEYIFTRHTRGGFLLCHSSDTCQVGLIRKVD